jgi:hypothetical protein
MLCQAETRNGDMCPFKARIKSQFCGIHGCGCYLDRICKRCALKKVDNSRFCGLHKTCQSKSRGSCENKRQKNMRCRCFNSSTCSKCNNKPIIGEYCKKHVNCTTRIGVKDFTSKCNFKCGIKRSNVNRTKKSPKKQSPKKQSPKRQSPRKQQSPKRQSPKRQSPKRQSPKRQSPKRQSPKRQSPKTQETRKKQFNKLLDEAFEVIVFNTRGKDFIDLTQDEQKLKKMKKLSNKWWEDKTRKDFKNIQHPDKSDNWFEYYLNLV